MHGNPPRPVDCCGHAEPPLQPHVNLSPTNAAPNLRLVGAADAAPDSRALRREVALENHAAGNLSVGDVGDVFAARVVSALDGGRAAILRPQIRRQLVAAGVRMGLRPFEANLVIALVQDSVRQGTDDRGPRAHLVRVQSVVRPRGALSSALLWVALTLVLTCLILAALVTLTSRK